MNVVRRRAWLVSLLGLALGCSPEKPSELAFSELGDEVERDGWLDGARTLAGDGATSFDSFPASGRPGGAVASARPSFVESDVDAAPLTSRVGDHLLSLSRFRGLVSTRVVGSDAPRVESSVPLGGLPVGLVVSDGVAAALVLDPLESRCGPVPNDGSGCVEHQTSRVVLVDVQDPASLRALGEQRFEGAVYAARQVGSTLHLLTRQIVDCYECLPGSTTPSSWLAFDRSVPGELRAPRVTPTPGDAFFEGERLFMLTVGVVVGTGVAELRVAELSQPGATLSAPVALGSSGLAIASGDRVRVINGAESPHLETFALGPGGAVSLGRGALALPEGEALWRVLLIEGDRGVALLEPSGKLAVLELSDPNAPRVTSLLDLELVEGELVLAGDRVLAMGRSTRAVDARPDDVVAHGPQAVVLVDIADPAASRVLDRQTLGSFNSVRGGLLELRGERALVSYYDEFPTARGGAEPEGGSCGRSNLRLMGYDLSTGQLSPAFAFDGLDTGARVEPVGDDWWVASDVSVSRYAAGAGGTPVARAELTRSIERLRALPDGVALFGVDFSSGAPTLELAAPPAPIESTPLLDAATEVGLPRVGCYERRSWGAPAVEHDGKLYALRVHSLPGDAGPGAAATLHELGAAAPGAPPRERALELAPLAAGEAYLGAVQTDRALLIARGRQDDTLTQTGYGLSLFVVHDTDPTSSEQSYLVDNSGYDPGDVPRSGAQLSYDVVDLTDPTGPVLASRLDIDAELATAGFFRFPSRVTRDTAWGFHSGQALGGPVVISGSTLAGQHLEAVDGGRFRFYLDRVDLSDPAAPARLEPVEIPGNVLDFDAATGALITLETLRLLEPLSERCVRPEAVPQGPEQTCMVLRRALNGLVLGDAGATRVGRLLLDADERDVVRLAVSNGNVYYATQRAELAGADGAPFAPRAVSIERVVLRDGRLERQASFDLAGSSSVPPGLWEQFVARGDRALWVAGEQLFVADFTGAEPRLEAHDIGPWGCASLDLRADVAYCAQGQAGYVQVPLGGP